MERLELFASSDFETFISWIDSEELLVQIAGHYFSYPLTKEQLQKYLNDEKSISFNIIEPLNHKIIGHAEIYKPSETIYKIDKLIIDPSERGKGIGLLAMNELLDYCFKKLNAVIVELFVFEQNISAIKTYEKAGFETDYNKKMPFEVNGKTWQALKMTIGKQKWEEKKN